MKSIKVRLKDNADMRWSKKNYSFLCPIDNIEIGDYVLLDSKKGNRFSLGKVTDVGEENAFTAYAYVICKLPIKDLDRRLNFIKKKRIEHLSFLKNQTKKDI